MQPDPVIVEPVEIDVAALQTQGAADLAPTVRAPALLADPDGTIIAAVAKYGDGLPALRAAARSYPAGKTLRSSGVRNQSRSFGFVARNQVLQRNGCRTCAGALEAPEAHTVLVAAAAQLAAIAADWYPDRFAADMDLVAGAVLPEWRMSPDGPWTSGVVNFDSPLPYHYDRNNFDCWSTMVTFRRSLSGGHLHTPAWNLPDGSPIVFACDDGDVLMFNGQTLFHGVTPLRLHTPSSYRVSVVYYAVKRMKECLPFSEEIAHARQARSNAEDHWKERQAAL